MYIIVLIVPGGTVYVVMTVEQTGGVVKLTVPEPAFRTRINVPFRLALSVGRVKDVLVLQFTTVLVLLMTVPEAEVR